MEWKIGEIFEHNGEWYQCVESEQDVCTDCAFNPINGIGYNCSGSCTYKQVIFKKLEKVGEPYEHCGKLYQCYKLPMEIEIRLLPNNCNPIGKDNLVEIEIKQNKEDMEENKLNLKPFNIQKAREGKPVCTRDGRKVRIICFDTKGSTHPIVALIEKDEKEVLNLYMLNGKKYEDEEEWKGDLMMLPEKKEGWIIKPKDYQVYQNKEDAERVCNKDYQVIAKISWEE